MKAIENSAECPQCGGGHKSKPFCVYENGFYCFSCGFSKSSDRSFTPPRNIHTDNPEFPECTNNPNDFTIEALKWLVGFHISPELIRKYQVHQALDGSLIYPQIDATGLITMYQQRWLGEQRKIITKGAKSPSFCSKGNETLIIVEDYLSFIRISDLDIYDVCCLWGTKLDWDSIKDVVNKYETIFVWLDNDCNKTVNSGQIAAEKLINSLEKAIVYRNRRRWNYQQTVWNIATDHDPKFYCNSEIKQIIGDVYGLSDEQ